VTQQPDGLSRRGSADRAPVTNGVADNYRNQVVLNITSQYANFVYIVQVTSVSFYRTSLGKQRVEKPRWRRGRKQHKKKSRKTLISTEKPSTREIVPASAVLPERACSRPPASSLAVSAPHESRIRSRAATIMAGATHYCVVFHETSAASGGTAASVLETRAFKAMLFSVAMRS